MASTAKTCGDWWKRGLILAVNFFLPSPPLRGRGVGGEGVLLLPSPPLRGRGVGGEGVVCDEEKHPLTPNPSPPKRGRGEKSILAVSVALALALGETWPRPAVAEPPRPLTTEQVKELQEAYAKERAATATEERTGLFAPEWYTPRMSWPRGAKRPWPPAASWKLGKRFGGLAGCCPACRSMLRLTSPEYSATANCGTHRPSWPWLTAPTAVRWPAAARMDRSRSRDAHNGRELRSLSAHAEGVRALAFRPDSQQLASAGGDKIKLWEVDTGKEIRSFAGHKDKEAVASLAFSLDGKRLVSGGSDKNILVHDVASGSLLYTATEDAAITGIAFSPDGKLFVAIGSAEHSVSVWDGLSNETRIIARFPVPTVNAVLFSPDSRQLIVGGADGIIHFHDHNSLTERRRFMGSSISPVTCLALSKDGKTLASGHADRSVRLWDMIGGQNFRTFQGHAQAVRALAFSPDGTTLASAGLDQVVRLWEVSGSEQTRILTGHEAAVWSAVFSPDGKHIVSASADRTVRVWETESGKQIHTLKGHSAPVTAALFSPDGQTIVSCGGDKVLRLWDAVSGKELRTFKGHEGVVTAIAFDADGKRLVSGAADQLVKVWEVATAKELYSFKGHTAVVSAVAFHPDGKSVASASADQTIKLWPLSPQNGKETTLTGHAGSISSLAFSPDGRRLASGGSDQQVKVWTLTPEPTALTLLGHSGPVSSVAWSTDGRFLVSCGADQIVRVWDVQSKQPQEAQGFRGHKDWVSSAAFSPDGSLIVSASVDRTLRLWKRVNRDTLPGAGHGHEILAVAISPDGKMMASGASDQTVRLWAVATGRELVPPMAGHGDKVTTLAFSPDGKTLVSAAGPEDHALKVWNTATGKEIRTIRDPGPNNEVPVLLITPDGKQILAWVANSLVEVYDLESGKQLSSRTVQEHKLSSLAFGADGELIAAGGEDGSVRILNLAKLTPLPGGEFPATSGGAGRPGLHPRQENADHGR